MGESYLIKKKDLFSNKTAKSKMIDEIKKLIIECNTNNDYINALSQQLIEKYKEIEIKNSHDSSNKNNDDNDNAIKNKNDDEDEIIIHITI